MDLSVQNETAVNPECIGVLADALQIGTGNGGLETNISCGNASTLLIPQLVRQRGKRKTKHNGTESANKRCCIDSVQAQY